MTDQRQPYLIVRPASEPSKAERRKPLPDNQALLRLETSLGDVRWFHLELASVWPLELDE